MNLYANRIHDLDRARRNYAEAWMECKEREMGYEYLREAMSMSKHKEMADLREAFNGRCDLTLAQAFRRMVDAAWYPIAYQAACEECEG